MPNNNPPPRAISGLDLPHEDFRAALQATVDLVMNLYQDLSEKRVTPRYNAREIQDLFAEALPGSGTDVAQVLDRVERQVVPNSTLNVHPGYYAYITGGGSQVGIIASLVQAALNQNNLKWNSAPANSEIERCVLRWIAEFLGYPEDSGGILCSGGSVANFLALAVARKHRSGFDVSVEGLYGRQPQTIYVSEQGHSSIDKAVDMLGLGQRYLRKIPVDADCRMDLTLLDRTIGEDIKRGYHPLCLVGIAGTTNTGAVDPLDNLAEIAARFGMWFHIDAAYGGPAAGLPGFKGVFSGIEKADSLIVNPHKWFYVPFEVACVYTKNRDDLKDTFSLVPDYLRSASETEGEDLMHSSLQLTKDFKALKVWMTLLVYGADRLRQAIRADIDHAAYLEECILASSDFELTATRTLSIVCFRYLGSALDQKEADRVNAWLPGALSADGRVFLNGTRLDNRPTLRVCCLNHRRTRADLDSLLHVIREVGERYPK